MGMRFVERDGAKNIYFTEEDNQRCLSEISEWRPRRLVAKEIGKLDDAPIPNFTAVCIYKIAEKISYRYNYRDHHYREDLVSDAVMNLMRYLHGFDPVRIGEVSGKVNFFSWVTKCVDRSFGNMIMSEKRQEYYKLATFEQIGGFAAFSEDGDFMAEGTLTSEMAQDFITKARDYENNETTRAEKQKARQAAKLEVETPPLVVTNPLQRFFKK